MPFYFGWHRWSEIERSVKAGTTVALAFPGSTLERTTHNVPGILLKLRDMPNAVRTPPQSAMLIEPPVVDEGGYPHITQTWQHWKYAVGPIRRSPWKLPYDSMPGPTHTLSRQGSKLFAECYTVSDVQEVVRISAAHKLEIDMIDYMGSDYWGSDVWPKTGGQPPVIAITNAFENLSGEQKVAGLVAQAFAEGLRVLIKPAMASRTHRSRRNVMDEARSAFAHGLYNATEALASVTSVPADIAGYGDRIGQVREGFDADLILWSMHPLRYEAPYVATPVQVWIDGIAQVPGKVPFLETDQEWLLPPRPLSKHRRQAGR